MVKNAFQLDVKVKCLKERITQTQLAEMAGAIASYISRLKKSRTASWTKPSWRSSISRATIPDHVCEEGILTNMQNNWNNFLFQKNILSLPAALRINHPWPWHYKSFFIIYFVYTPHTPRGTIPWYECRRSGEYFNNICFQVFFSLGWWFARTTPFICYFAILRTSP